SGTSPTRDREAQMLRYSSTRIVARTLRNPNQGPTATQTARLATARRQPRLGPATASGTSAVDPARKPYPSSGPSIKIQVPHPQSTGSGPGPERTDPKTLTTNS